MPRGVMNLETSTKTTTIKSQDLTPYVPKTHYSSGNESTGGKIKANKLFKRGKDFIIFLSFS